MDLKDKLEIELKSGLESDLIKWTEKLDPKVDSKSNLKRGLARWT